MKSDEAILCGQDFIDFLVSELKQRIKIGCRDSALDYFSNNPTFHLRPLALGDVAGHALHGHSNTVLIDQPSANLDGHALAVLCPNFDFVVGEPLPVQLRIKVLANTLHIFRSHKIGEVLADYLVARVTSELFRGSVY